MDEQGAAKTPDCMPVKPNIRRRFWRWVLGQDDPPFTKMYLDEAIRFNNPNRGAQMAEMLEPTKRFSIVTADNGKIILYWDLERLEPSRTLRETASAPRYFLVPQDQDLLASIAKVLAISRLEK